MKLKIKRGRRAEDEPAGRGDAAKQATVVESQHAFAQLPTRQRVEPAPAGALLRAELRDELQNEAEGEPAYVPRRGGAIFRTRLMLASVAGRVALGTACVVLLGAAGVGTWELRQTMLHDDRFTVGDLPDIEITGNSHLTRQQIEGVFAADALRNIFHVPLAERRADLERLPWVEHATVMRLLPNTLRVTLTERTPVAFVRQGTQIGLVDANGVLLDMPAQSAGDPTYSFPVLAGLDAAGPASARKLRVALYQRFMKEIAAGGERATASISEVDVANPEDVKALVTTDGADVLVHFGEEQFLHRYQTLQQHIADWRQTYPKLSAADMRYENQVVLEMQQGSAAATATDASAANVTDAKAEPGAMAATAAKSEQVAKPVAAKKPAHKAAVRKVAAKAGHAAAKGGAR